MYKKQVKTKSTLIISLIYFQNDDSRSIYDIELTLSYIRLNAYIAFFLISFRSN